MPMPLSLCTLLKLPPSDHPLNTRQFCARPPKPAHQKAEVTCWIQTLSTSQLLPLKLTAPLLFAPSRLEPLQSSATFWSVLEVVVIILATPMVLFAGVTR